MSTESDAKTRVTFEFTGRVESNVKCCAGLEISGKALSGPSPRTMVSVMIQLKTAWRMYSCASGVGSQSTRGPAVDVSWLVACERTGARRRFSRQPGIPLRWATTASLRMSGLWNAPAATKIVELK